MSDEEEEDGEVLQMRHIAPSATAPHLERIDERGTSISSDTDSVLTGRIPRTSSAGPGGRPSEPSTPQTTVASVEFQPLVPSYPNRPNSDEPLNSATSDVQSPRPDYHPETTPLLSQRR